MQEKGERHITVLLHESVDSLKLTPGAIALDATLGNAGHSREICKLIGKDGMLIAIDLDTNAIEEAKRVLDHCPARVSYFEGNFRNLDQALEGAEVTEVDAILMDLGIRTEQLFTSGRGFSFGKPEEPLVMTFSANPLTGVTAADALNYWSEETLADVIFRFADEPKARKIARLIVERRGEKDFETVGDLLEVIDRAYKGKKIGRTNPATKTFQALRIAVNDEMGALDEGLRKGFEALKIGGVMSVITFHSLEDRIVKRFSKALAEEGKAELAFKKPLTPSEEELEANPRARSAKLRSWRKLEN